MVFADISAARRRGRIPHRTVHLGARTGAWLEPQRSCPSVQHRDIGKGHKALSTVLLTGIVPLHNQLAEGLEVDDALFRAVIDATMRQKWDEARRRRAESERAYRASFRPYLQVQTERQVPSPIFVAALLTVARLRIVLRMGRLLPTMRPEIVSSRPSSSTIGARKAGVFPPSEG